MAARYIVRFDDICQAMDRRVWERLVPVLQRHGVKPILAAVPDNRDHTLVVDAARADFWQRLRGWQAADWTIALHGHQQPHTTRDAGLVGLKTVDAVSEFAGQPEAVQRDELQQELDRFATGGVRVDAWVAPAHSFDATTVKLLLEFGVGVVSDGFYTRPVRHLDAAWVPQQRWRFRQAPFGLQTVCYHHNQFEEAAISAFAADIARHADRIGALPPAAAVATAPQRNLLDMVMSAAWLVALKLRRHRAAA